MLKQIRTPDGASLLVESKPDTAEYRWVIIRDHLELDGIPSDKGACGPRNASKDVQHNPQKFTMYDDDDHCYYTGMIYGDYSGFEPLDDFGMPNAGCTDIRYGGESL